MSGPALDAHAVSYDPGELVDEAFAAPGELRPTYEDLLAELAGHDLEELRRDVAARVEAQGTRFAAHEPYVVDPVPRVLDGEEWAALAAGLEQRVTALEAFVADVYGPRRAVAEGVVPERVVATAGHLEPEVAAHHRPVNVGIAGLDVVRAPDGDFRVLEDNVRTPSGIAYALAARAAVGMRLQPGLPDPAPAVAATLRRLLGAAGDGGRVALLSDGPHNSAWWEHQRLARLLDVPLVLPEDLETHGDRLHARGAGELAAVYRRTDEDRLHEPGGGLTDVGARLDRSLRAGTLACVNAFGAGVADDKLVEAYVEDLVRFFCREEPLLRSVRTFDLADPVAREEALDLLPELVLKPRSGHGGAGVLIGAHARPADLDAAVAKARSHPERWIAQELVRFSRHPTVIEGGLEPRHVDLRPFVVWDGERAEALPVALTRVAFAAGALVVNSSQRGGAKDTWLLRP